MFQISILVLRTAVTDNLQNIPDPREIPHRFLCVCLHVYFTEEKIHRFYWILKEICDFQKRVRPYSDEDHLMADF